jgi:hypothetical protein
MGSVRPSAKSRGITRTRTVTKFWQANTAGRTRLKEGWSRYRKTAPDSLALCHKNSENASIHAGLAAITDFQKSQ